MGLGHDAQHLALREDHGAVVEPLAVAQGRADDDDQRQLARGADRLRQRLVGRVEQQGLQQQIAARVARHGQLGEDDDLDASLRGLLGQRDDAGRVAVAVGDPHFGNGRRDLQKSEIIHVPFGKIGSCIARRLRRRRYPRRLRTGGSSRPAIRTRAARG